MMAVFFYSLLTQQRCRELTAKSEASPSSPANRFTPCPPRGGGTPIHHRVIKVMLGKHYGSSHKIIRFLSSSTVSDQSDWSRGHLTGGYNC